MNKSEKFTAEKFLEMLREAMNTPSVIAPSLTDRLRTISRSKRINGNNLKAPTAQTPQDRRI